MAGLGVLISGHKTLVTVAAVAAFRTRPVETNRYKAKQFSKRPTSLGRGNEFK